MMRTAWLIACAIGCGGSSTPDPQPDAGSALLPGFELPAAPDPSLGMRLIAPITDNIEPGSSHEMCSWTGIQVDHDIDLRKVVGFQGATGHHIILYASHLNYPAGTSHECTDAEMASFRMVAASGSEGLPSEAPGDLVYRIDKGMYLVLQSHYLNASDDTVSSQSALDLYYADAGKTYTPSHAIAILNTAIDLPPGDSSIDVHCTMEHDILGWYAIPHMHQWGKTFSATITHNGTATKMWDDLPWDPMYMFSPPAKTYPIDAPQLLAKGDTIDVHCEWNNDTQNHLFFGNEMCVFFIQTIDKDGLGSLDCDNGSWGSF